MADDAELRRRYAARAAGSPAGHLDESGWERFACGELDLAERQRAFDHIARCAECAAVWRSVSALRREAAAFDPALPRPRREARAPWVLSGLAAAAAVAALGVMLAPAAWRPSPRGAESTRSAADQARPRLVSPIGRVVQPAEFRWGGVPGTRAYRVRVFRDAELVWSSVETTGTSLAWPASLQLPPGRYFWQVVAIPSSSRGDADQVASEPAPLDVGSGR
jgi:hypothetical protein